MITGAILSSTVTKWEQIDVLPLSSDTRYVRVTTLGQVKPLSTSLSKINDAALIVQLSVATPPLLVNAASVRYTGFSPAAHTAVKSAGQVNVGARLSSTVTVATQVDTLPAASVTVKVTLLSPVVPQVNEVVLIVAD